MPKTPDAIHSAIDAPPPELTAPEITWETPPERTSSFRKPANQAFWEALARNPGQWAIYKRDFKGGSSQFKNSHPQFEFATRTIKECTGDDCAITWPTDAKQCPNCGSLASKPIKVCYAKYIGVQK